jgi:hypothetical protein
MTPAQKADHQAVMANLSDAMTPMAVKILQQLKQKILFKNPNETPAEVVNMDTVSPAAQADSIAVTSPVAPQTTLSPTALSTIGEMGPATPVAITSPVAPQTTLSPTALGGVSSGIGTSSGMGGMGTGAAGAAASGVSPGAAAAAANAAAASAVGSATSGGM